MNDLISRRAVVERIENEYREWGDEYDALQILGDIEDLPSAEPSQQKEAHWIDITHHIVYRCSYCGYYVDVNNIRDYKFCPHCGARMDG